MNPTATTPGAPILPLPLWERVGERDPAARCPDPATAPPAHNPGPLRNANPRGNPNLAPRCGAKARTTGCPGSAEVAPGLDPGGHAQRPLPHARREMPWPQHAAAPAPAKAGARHA